MLKRLPVEGELIMTGDRVTGYGDDVNNQLALVCEAKWADNGRDQEVAVRLLSTGERVLLFENEYRYPDEEQEQ